jgi:ankyrin repeat protein
MISLIKNLLLKTIAAVVLVTTAFADAIHDAAAKGDLAGVQAELDKGVDVNTKGGAAGVPALLLAALNGHMEVTELLTANGADLGGADKFGNSPLHYAAHHGNKEIVILLITNSADVNAKCKGGETPLSMAANKETADLIRKHGGKYGTFIAAVAGGDIDAVKMFLDAGSDVNEKVQHGWTPLHEAAVFGHAEVTKLLIANGADVNAWDGYETPLDVSDNESEFADLLRKHGGKTGAELKAEGK